MYRYYNKIFKAAKQIQFRELYYFPGLSFEIRCDSPELLDQVCKFLHPHLYTKGEKRQQEWKICYIHGDINMEQQREEKIIGTYGGDSLVTAGFYEDNGVYYYYNIESGNETIVNPGEREALVVYNSDIIDLNLLEDCYAIIRTICYSHLCRMGAILIHGCALKYKNKTILLAGDKGAGKTTMQHYLLQELKADFISADRTIAWIDNRQVVCTGWISTYRPDISILDLLPESEGTQRIKEYYRNKKDDPLYFQKNKIRIPPGELTEMLRIGAIPVSRIDILFILDNPGRGDSYTLEEIDAGRAEALCTKFIIDLKKQGVDSPMRDEECESQPASHTLEQLLAEGTKFYLLTGRGKLDEIKSLLREL